MNGFIERVRKGNFSEQDKALIEHAYEFARKAHEGQVRSSGEPFFTHPCEVATIVMDMELDAEAIAAALLHDVVEDTSETTEGLKREFGTTIAELTDGLTRISKVELTNREERQVEDMRKMLLAMSQDIRVILIKLADRLHNMRTLQYKPEQNRLYIAQETLDIYAPIANRLGIFTIKSELEDLALRYLDPEAYADLKAKIAEKRDKREDEIKTIIAQIGAQLLAEKIDARIEGRPKHFYSIYRKMTQQGKDFDQIFDILAVRIIVETVRDCYEVLGIVHTMWKPIPGRIKDYIAMPKENLYQSLHTTLIGPNGMPFEVQIRTKEMHMTAEYGIAAHWKYKENHQGDSDLEAKLKWLRQLLEMQNETDNANEYIDNLKSGLFAGEVFVFTPKGDVITLPRGSTPVDFAYAIHSAVGNRCVGAKANGRMVQLDTELNTGDIVEIITSKNSRGPSRDWLNIVKSSQARSKIRAWFKKEYKQENIEKGRLMMEESVKRTGISLQDLLRNEWLKSIFKRFTLNSIEDMYAAIGYGGIPAGQVLRRLMEEYKKEQRIKQKNMLEEVLGRQGAAPEPERPAQNSSSSDSHGVRVRGETGLLVRFARCCNPVPNDPIIGFITRGRGVSIHRMDCTNIAEMLNDSSRLIDVAWENNETSEYRAQLQLVAYDSSNLFVDITNAISGGDAKLLEVNARMGKQNAAEMTLVVSVKSKQQLDTLIKVLKKLPEVIEVFRTGL